VLGTPDIRGLDKDSDGDVDPHDLLALCEEWLVCADPNSLSADLNGDSIVDFKDLVILGGQWNRITTELRAAIRR
jgi:hypothetical protein